ncbi:DUF2256 domain-containing protein [Candidatus Dojkabacteria bacterium]|uniref:DUF2256 domain-containing protein n=1 Tax=Candidatus Dojkabacteria bacterium TaxID=2099670 RepID=A0A3M0Z307_9BACT|nr:MAG: DUF2256 domain-containing protein [Candidatus Dojkabacteria bacterium]
MSQKIKLQVKVCVNCKRPFQNRKKWNLRRVWHEVKYCSDRCRKEFRKKTLYKN